MSVSNLFKRSGLKWLPDADIINAPEDALLRADNLVPDKIGALTLRRGSSQTYTGLDGDTIHSLASLELYDGNTYHAMGVGDNVYVNDTKLGSMNGSGDIAIGDDSYQIFFARGNSKKKFDGENWYNWGIGKPLSAPSVDAVSNVSSTIADFNNSESPACTIQEGSGPVGGESDADGSANEGTKLTPDGSTFRGVVQRLWTSDQDFYTISSLEGSETDLFDVYLKIENPADVETIQVVFGLDDSSTEPFTNNRLEFEFDLRNKKDIPLKDLESEGYSSYETAILSQLESVRPADVTGLRTPDQVKEVLAKIGKTPSPTSAPPKDKDVWGHLTVTRGQFKRVGNDEDRGWDTVRGFKIIYKTRSGKVPYIILADAIMVGGGERCLTGTYQVLIRGVRNFDDHYYELGLPSDPSAKVNLNHQTLQVTIDSTTISTLDPQCDQIWIYIFGGWLDAWYRIAIVPAQIPGGMTIDELTTPAGSDLDSKDERARIPSWGFTLGIDDISGDLAVNMRKSELDVLTENERLEPYLQDVPDDIIDIAGPWRGRMFVLTSEGYVYPSSNRSPSVFNSVQVIDLTRFGDPLWIAKTASGIHVGCERDVIFLAGSGDDSTDLGTIDLFPQQLNIGNPPIDSCHWVDGNAIVYRSSDGMMMLTGSSITPIPMAGTSLLWRGVTRHGVSGINTSTGRFRCTVDDNMLYILVPEGTDTSGNVIYRYAPDKQQWSRLVFDQVTSFRSIGKSPTGALLAGDEDGTLWTLDAGDNDNLSDIAISVRTPLVDGGNPLARKEAFDLQIHCNTGSDSGTVNLYKDGSASLTSTYTFSTLVPNVYRINASDFACFLRAQLEITGSFNTFTLNYFDLTFRVRPQHSMYLDTGYILPEDPGDMVWLQEAELDMNSANDVTVELYIDDALFYTSDVTVTANIRKTYLVPFPRNSKGYRPRIVVKTKASNAEGSVGFELYKLRARTRSTGNQSGWQYNTVYPVGQAP